MRRQRGKLPAGGKREYLIVINVVWIPLWLFRLPKISLDMPKKMIKASSLNIALEFFF